MNIKKTKFILVFLIIIFSLVIFLHNTKKVSAFQCSGTDNCSVANHECCDSIRGQKPRCVPCDPNNPGGGGRSCSPGTTYTCGAPPVLICPVFSSCDFPYKNTGVVCDETGSKRRRNLTEWYYCQVNCLCLPNCSTTAPTNVSITMLSASNARITWTPGTGGTSQRVYVGANKTEVESNCPGVQSPACAVSATGLPTGLPNYVTGNVLSTGTVYYVKVVNYDGASCNSSSPTNRFLSSCSISPASATLNVGGTQALVSTINSSTEITNVTFTSSSPVIASVSPASDASYVYQTSVTANSPGSTTVTSNVYFGAILACSANSAITVTNLPSWWQVKDGDMSANGNISSIVPLASYFDIIGAGGFPGVPVYNGNLSVAPGTVSTKLWAANTSTTDGRLFNYSYFANLVPSDVTPTVATDASLRVAGFTLHGYEWFKSTGSLTIANNIDFGARKIILLVENGNLTVNGRINLTNNSGFFGAFVNGNISIRSTVTGSPTIEGIYLADGNFSTGAGTSQLHVRGSIASYGGINLQRDLADNSIPAELFEFAPDQIVLFPDNFGYRRTKWVEVAP